MIGQYRIKNLIGAGGMGIVYAAEHSLIGRPAAVKVLLPEYSHNQQIVSRFFNEAKAATAIRHPGIVEIYDFGWHTDGSAYIVMEYLDGETLGTRRKRMPMSWQESLAFGRQIARALAAAHSKGIVHRDLKPDNIFIVADPENPGAFRIKLLDFGIAKLAGEQTAENRTRTGAVIGTPTYMSPEQCRGVAVDHRADLYSLGVILFRLIAGRAPFVGEGEGDVLAAHIHVPPPALSSLAPGVPPSVEQLVHGLLQKAPGDRPQTADQVVALMDAALASAASVPGNLAQAASAPGLQLAASASSSSWSTPPSAFVPLPSPLPSTPTQPTTLSGAAGNTPVPVEPRRSGRTGLIAALVASGVAGIVIAIALSHAGSSTSKEPAKEPGKPENATAPAATNTAATDPPAPPTPSPTPPPPSEQAAGATPTPAPPAEPQPAPPADKPATVALHIVSTPDGADVMLGAKRLGATPLDGTLPIGDAAVKLTLRKSGYKDQVLSVVPSAAIDQTVELQVRPKQTTTSKTNRDKSVNPF